MELTYKYHYFYKIVNLITGQYYYGIHSTNNLDDGYMGSGRRLKMAYRMYGKENFTKTILKFFETREMASVYESQVVDESCVLDVNCYNMKIGGDFGTTIGTILCKDENGVFYRVKPDDEDYLNGKLVPFATGLVSVLDEANGRYKNIPMEEYRSNKDKYITPTKGRITVKDVYGSTKSVPIEEYHNGEFFPLWTGKHHSEEAKLKMSITHKNNHDQVGEKNSQYGKCWVTNGIDNKSIKKEDLEEYIKLGWKPGRKFPKEQFKGKLDGIPLDEIKKLKNDGLTWKELGAIYGVTKSTFYRYIKRMEG